MKTETICGLAIVLGSCCVAYAVGWKTGLSERTLVNMKVTHGECMGCGAGTVITIKEYKKGGE